MMDEEEFAEMKHYKAIPVVSDEICSSEKESDTETLPSLALESVSGLLSVSDDSEKQSRKRRRV